MHKQSSSPASMAPGNSRRAVAASAIFGITAPCFSGSARAHQEYLSAATELDRQLLPGQIALVTGPSGGGKSSILRSLSTTRRAGGRHANGEFLFIRSIAPQSLIDLTGFADAPARSIVDLFDASIQDALCLLAAAGLGEASLFARCFHALSDGQKHRLFLALALASASRNERGVSRADSAGRTNLAVFDVQSEETRRGRGQARRRGCRMGTILIDEFCSLLDRLSARAIAESVSKWMRSDHNHVVPRGQRPRLIVATAHDDLDVHLRPDLVVRVPLEPDPLTPIQILPG
ncbi:MAG: hypothetical protein H7210_01940 [Pyrinomonadaceae bacterium]|nr:hypothetical protein [Phycisphaerales bacterium]